MSSHSHLLPSRRNAPCMHAIKSFRYKNLNAIGITKTQNRNAYIFCSVNCLRNDFECVAFRIYICIEMGFQQICDTLEFIERNVHSKYFRIACVNSAGIFDMAQKNSIVYFYCNNLYISYASTATHIFFISIYWYQTKVSEHIHKPNKENKTVRKVCVIQNLWYERKWKIEEKHASEKNTHTIHKHINKSSNDKKIA